MLTFNEGITIYNKRLDPETRLDKWNRTQLPEGCSWYGGQAVTVGESGLVTADKYSVRILDWAAVGYVTPDKWIALSDEAEAWTLQSGDVVVRGMVDQEVVSGITEITRAFSDCFVITSVHDNRRIALGHIRIEGK